MRMTLFEVLLLLFVTVAAVLGQYGVVQASDSEGSNHTIHGQWLSPVGVGLSFWDMNPYYSVEVYRSVIASSDETDTCVIAWPRQNDTSTLLELHAAVSHDGCVSFGPEQQVYVHPNISDAAEVAIVHVNDGIFIISFTLADTNGLKVMAARSVDNGESWGAPYVVVDGSSSQVRVGASAMTRVGNGTVVVMSFHVNYKLYFSRSVDAGETWSTPQRVSPTLDGDDRLSSIASDSTGDVLVLVWRNWGFNMHIAASVSTTQGANWSTPTILSTSGDMYQFDFPSVSTDGSGLWVVAWEGRIEQQGRTQLRVEYAMSRDDGQTWETPRKLDSSVSIRHDSSARIEASKRGDWVLLFTRDDPSDIVSLVTTTSTEYLLSPAVDKPWSTPKILVPFLNNTLFQYLPTLVASRDGDSWYATWIETYDLYGPNPGSVEAKGLVGFTKLYQTQSPTISPTLAPTQSPVSFPPNDANNTLTVTVAVSVSGVVLSLLISLIYHRKKKPRIVGFLSHYQKEAGETAELLKLVLKSQLRNSEPFLDVDNLENKGDIPKHVVDAGCVYAVLTPGYFSRPYCVVELCIAKRENIPVIPILVVDSNLDPNANPVDAGAFQSKEKAFQFFQSIFGSGGSNLFASDGDWKVLESYGFTAKDVDAVARFILDEIWITFPKHDSTHNRNAQVQDILKDLKKSQVKEINTSIEAILRKVKSKKNKLDKNPQALAPSPAIGVAPSDENV